MISVITDEALCYCGHELTRHTEGYFCTGSFCFGSCSRCRGKNIHDSCADCGCASTFGPLAERLRNEAEEHRRNTPPTFDEIRSALRSVQYDKEDLKRYEIEFGVLAIEEFYDHRAFKPTKVFRVHIRLFDSDVEALVREKLDKASQEYDLPPITLTIEFPVADSSGRVTSRSLALREMQKRLSESIDLGRFVLGRDKTGFVFRKGVTPKISGR
jgi:hypothetical protein